jgi:hypothetical protein
MSNYTTRLRTILRLTILFCCALNVMSAETNVTVPDTDPSITYQPPSSWHSSSNLCSLCLNPELPTTFHEGIHEAAGPDTDDIAKQEQEEHEKEEKAKKDQGKRRSFQRRFEPLPRDTDDGTPDPAVNITFNFSGSAVYVFGIIPPTIMNVNSTSPNMNLTFFLDNNKIENKPMAASRLAIFSPNQTLFSHSGLSESPHQLVISLGPNSTFIFQKLIYTTDIADPAVPTVSSSASTPSTSTQSSPSPTTQSNSKHNVATFAGAVGGGVGVLALFSFGLALSIIIRRRKSIRRDRQDHESLHTNASDDSPAMSGPAPFVPRYFPDTIIPSEPPTYNAALATSHGNSTLLARLTPAALMATPTEEDEDEEDRSYADVPPAMPPPPVEDLAAMLRRPPPPPFVVAATSPPPPPPPGIFMQRPEGALLPTIVPGVAAPAYDANERASVVVDVGTEPLPSILPPEQVPLLQAIDATESIAPVVPISRVHTPAPISSSASSMYVQDPPDLPESRTISSSEPSETTPPRENVS